MGDKSVNLRGRNSRGIPKSWKTDVTKWELFNISSILSLTQDKDVLDVGCGKSWLTFEIALVANSVMGIDPNKDYIENSKRLVKDGHLNNIGFINKPFEDTKFGDNVFDVVVFADSLHHMKHPAGTLMSYVHPALQPNGHVIIIESTDEGNYYEAERVFLDEGEDHLRVDDAIEESIGSGKFIKEDVWNLKSTKTFKTITAMTLWYMLYYRESYKRGEYQKIKEQLDKIFTKRMKKKGKLNDVRTMKVTVLRKIDV